VAGRDNGLNAPYSPGDANLDGVVDTQDFAIWNANRFTSEAAWSRGDFNADGVVDGSDFNVWLKNRFERVPPAVAANAKRLVRPVRQAAMPSQIDHIVMFSTASRSALRQQFGSKSGDPFYVTPDSVFVTANTPVGKRHVLQWNAPRQRREISNEAKAELIDIVLANDSLRPNADTLSHISQHELDIFLLSIFLSNYGIGQEYW
jgi:hypothetical protein